MELFQAAKTVRLKSHYDKYLLADEDEEHVSQDRRGSAPNARWSVELTDNDTILHLKSCYGRYLTASNEPYLLGMTGRKVLQTSPKNRLDSSVEWQPIRDGFQVKLKTRYGKFLRANKGPPPWRNSVTHDVPHRTLTQDWVLWDVEIVEIQTQYANTNTGGGGGNVQSPARPMPPLSPASEDEELSSPESTMSSMSSPRLSRDESLSSFSGSPQKPDARTIYYMIAGDDGSADISNEEQSFTFKGTGVRELTEKLEEETEVSGIIVCMRNPLNGKLNPLRLHLPPNYTTMHVVVVQASSKVAKGFQKQENLF